MNRIHFLRVVLAVLFAMLFARTARAAPPETQPTTQPTAQPTTQPTVETNCADGLDDDGDTVYDCGDHDCHDQKICQPDGGPENSAARCGDWVDNDEDGYLDCEDHDCNGVETCMGSWDRSPGQPVEGADKPGVGITGPGLGTEIPAGQVEEDLQGRGADRDGERTDYFCSDGYDNDGDGFTDCDDVGCKLGTEVSVCQPTGDIRFTVVARVGQTFTFAGPENGTKAVIRQSDNPTADPAIDPRAGENRSPFNTDFDALQLRALGQMPFIQNSFFLLSIRAEKTPRLTFATFQIPIKNGHYFNLNSGGGTLSLELIRSVHKRLMVDPAFYVYNAFEQGNGAAIEFGGPLDKRGKYLYRTFLAGGSGRFAGNVGGTFFPDDNRNFTWAAGAQLHLNLVGYYSRFDSPLLYTPSATAFAIAFGAKFDQRSQERYPAANFQMVFRWKRLMLLGEAYGKRELNFKNWQLAFNVQVGVLAVKRRLLLAADFGQYLATPFEEPPDELGSDLQRQLQELQYRVVAHIYLWRNVVLAQVVWRDRFVERAPSEVIPDGTDRRSDLRIMLLYRF
jgi:hypothetical protein